jgi:hypothetical protein
LTERQQQRIAAVGQQSHPFGHHAACVLERAGATAQVTHPRRQDIEERRDLPAARKRMQQSLRRRVRHFDLPFIVHRHHADGRQHEQIQQRLRCHASSSVAPVTTGMGTSARVRTSCSSCSTNASCDEDLLLLAGAAHAQCDRVLLDGNHAHLLGASHTGKAPAKCSMRIAMKRSNEPLTARWITTGRCGALSSPV